MTPALKIASWHIDRVLPYAKNARLHSDEQVGAIARSITEYGFINPCLVDDAGVLIAGHGRVLAAKALGREQIPVIKLGHLTEEQARALRIVDNALPLAATWDKALIAVEIGSLKLAGYDIGLLGFPEVQLRAWGITAGTAAAQDPEAAPERQAKPVVRPGDLWQLGQHRLLCGDSTKPEDVARVLADEKPGLMVTDPPYGDSYDPSWRDDRMPGVKKRAVGKVSNDHISDWRAAWKLFAGDVAYVWHGDKQAIEAGPLFRECGFELRSLIVWSKSRFVISRGHYHPQHEVCLYLVRTGATARWQGGHKQSTRWDISHTSSETGHGTQKPIECMRRPIENHTKKGDLVYEPFSGSGTTIIAAELTGRRALAIEIDPGYCQVALERWQGVSGQLATLDGVPLADVAEARREGRARRRRRSGK